MPSATPAESPKERLETAGKRLCTYDVDLIDNFLTSIVFHSDFSPDENVLVWAQTGSPAFPKTEDWLLKKLGRTKEGLPCYFATATVSPTDDGKLYNRKSQFNRLHVIVLDDIGTKVDAKKITAEPTYIIETSAGNFQYGFVFEEAIADYALAEALVSTVYTSGLTDSGGKLVGKLVRLPCGVNGKKGEHGDFKVRATKLDGPRYTPKTLIDGLGLDIDVKLLERDPTRAVKDSLTRAGQVSQWGQNCAQGASLAGYVDPVLEWLYEQNYVVQETDEWITIKCPWLSSHTTGGTTAGYSPAGWGAYPELRGFKCFHQHCETNDITFFLDWVAERGGPLAPVRDPAIELVKGYTLDPARKGAWEISRKTPKFYDMAGLELQFPAKAVINFEGAVQRHNAVKYWVMSPNCVRVDDAVLDPRHDSRLVKDDEGFLTLNIFSRPTYFDAQIDKAHIKKFNDFLTYLIPSETERAYFLNWVSMKIRQPSFRGAGIVMCTRAFGVGRNSLAKILARLVGENNHEEVDVKALFSGDDYAEHAAKVLVTCSETRDGNMKANAYYAAYENLKVIVDPAVKKTTVNPKFGKRYTVYSTTSYLFMSNHTTEALKIPEGDRRFYMIHNADKPQPPEYYTELHKWIDGGAWVGSLWRWLHERDVGDFNGNAPAPMTDLKRAMTESSVPMLTRILDTLLAEIGLPLIPVGHVNILIRERIAPLLDLSEHDLKSLQTRLRTTLEAAGNSTGKTRMRLTKVKSTDPELLKKKPVMSLVPKHKDADMLRERINIPSGAPKEFLEPLNVAKAAYADFVRKGRLEAAAMATVNTLKDSGY